MLDIQRGESPQQPAARLDTELMKAMVKDQIPVYEGLAAATDDLFARQRSGHMIRYVYNDSSMQKWGEYTAETPDYSATLEIGIIEDHADDFAAIGEELRRDGQEVTLLEQGTGAEHAILHKTLPTIKALRPDHYVPMDYVAVSAFNAATIARAQGAGLKRVIPLILDFNRASYHGIPEHGRRVFIQYGNTPGNIEGFPTALPLQEMNAALAHTRKHMRPGDYLILGINQEQAFDAAYNDPLFDAFHESFLPHLKTHLHSQSFFRPDDFRFFKKWIPQQHVHVFGYKAVRDGNVRPFGPRGKTRAYSEGDEFLTCNSWRYPQAFMDGLYAQNALELRHRWPDRQNKMSFQVLRAG